MRYPFLLAQIILFSIALLFIADVLCKLEKLYVSNKVCRPENVPVILGSRTSHIFLRYPATLVDNNTLMYVAG